MREILFRGKRKDNGKWAEGFYMDYGYINQPFTELGGRFDDTIEVDPETVGQYTGLTDKNGKKIFEGDIFKFNDEVWESCYTSCETEYDSWNIENYAVVGFDEETARYDFVKYKYNENSVEADLHQNHDIEFADFVGELKIIGNIHDNPELLKGGAEEWHKVS